MKKIILVLSALLVLVSFFQNTFAQSDSTYLDMGRLKQERNFTQSITIKGEDLDRFSFANLSDAISAWLFGGLSNRVTLVYVVDGVVMNDVNVYSIHDIEEVTHIQNATSVLNGAIGNEQLIIIKTRRATLEGIKLTVASNVALVKGYYTYPYSSDTPKSKGGLYQQQYVGLRRRNKKQEVGISLNYLRDLIPERKPTNYHEVMTPFNLDRFRLNSFINQRLTNTTSLNFNIGYTPQFTEFSEKNGSPDYQYTGEKEGKLSAFFGSIALNAYSKKGIINSLSLNFSNLSNKDNVTITEFTNNRQTERLHKLNEEKLIFVLKDDFRLDRKIGSLNLEPSLNLSLRLGYRFSGQEWILSDPTAPVNEKSTYTWSYSQVTATPALNLYYKNIFNIKGGAVTNSTSGVGNDSKTINPFISASADLIRLINPDAIPSLKVFSSYANGKPLFVDVNTLQDVNGYFPFWLRRSGEYSSDFYKKKLNSFQLGSTLALFNNALSVSYHYDRRNYTRREFGWDDMLIYSDARNSIHRLAVSTKRSSASGFGWTSGISFTRENTTSFYGWGRYDDFRNTFHGGWVNRLKYKGFGLGFDIVHLINHKSLSSDEVKNYYTLQNAFLGYDISVNNGTLLELYVSARNAVNTEDESLMDNRRYYGFGFKLSL